ncbi:outer membrane beta-barrel protein [Mesonia sp.]|uniref:outer membrane beta-barrel protein n=1 Tax=Mesonia sp. TaxID=1960830 RepID=UPI0017678771|nr:outer membrane beta-barrel protein [Mesonia sp.]HIB38564.1 hypothetical protein [Mesonia sp.]
MEPNNWKNKFDTNEEAFSPSDNVWEAIDQTVTKKRRKRRVIIFLLALLVICIPIGVVSVIQFDVINFNKNSKKEINNIILKDSSENEVQQKVEVSAKAEKEINIKDSNNQKSTSEKTLKTNGDNDNFSFKNSSDNLNLQQQINQQNRSKLNNTLSFNRYNLEANNIDSIALLPFGIIKNKFNLNPELLKKEDKHQLSQDSKLNWAVKPFFGGNLMKPLQKEHPLQSSNPNLSQNFQLNYSYGAHFYIQLNEDFWLYTGVAFQNYSYQAKNIHTSADRTPSLVHYINTSSNNFISHQTIEDFSNSSEEITLNYQLDYYEIPVIASYKVLDKKLNLNAEAGGSVLHLRNNKMSLSNQNDEELALGEFNIFKKSHFTLQAGLLAEWPLSKRFSLEAEGLYKYHFNIIDHISTYSINLNLGVKYKFKY